MYRLHKNVLQISEDSAYASPTTTVTTDEDAYSENAIPNIGTLITPKVAFQTTIEVEQLARLLRNEANRVG